MDGGQLFSNSKNNDEPNVRGTFAALEELEAVSTTKDADDLAIRLQARSTSRLECSAHLLLQFRSL